MKKRILAIMLCGIMLLMVGCASSEKEEKENSDSESNTVEQEEPTASIEDFLKALQGDKFEVDYSVKTNHVASESATDDGTETSTSNSNWIYKKDGDLSYLEVEYFPENDSVSNVDEENSTETETMPIRKFYINEKESVMAMSVANSAYQLVSGADNVSSVSEVADQLIYDVINELGLLNKDNYLLENGIYKYTNTTLASQFADEMIDEAVGIDIFLTVSSDICDITINLQDESGNTMTMYYKICNVGNVDLVWPLV